MVVSTIRNFLIISKKEYSGLDLLERKTVEMDFSLHFLMFELRSALRACSSTGRVDISIDLVEVPIVIPIS